MDVFFAQLFGIYFIVVGFVVLLRRKSIMPTMRELIANRPLLLTIALLELAAGLALVLTHSAIEVSWTGLISLIGWMMVVEGVLYLTLPSAAVQKFTKMFNRPHWYTLGGLLSILMGGYLAFVGFGLI